jgi:diguanylate cyclase (GGDEF)-like protein
LQLSVFLGFGSLRTCGPGHEVRMLSTIRGKFAAVLFLGLGLVCAGAFGLSSGQQAGADAAFGEPALFVGMLTLVVMLLIERIVIQPISGLTRGVVLLANGDPGDPRNRLQVKGSDEVATLARTFNGLLEHLAARQKLEAQLTHMAHHDGLTALPNRVLFRQEMERELARARGGETVAVLCIDLDHFKRVNDTLGHAAGDALLQGAADRLRACVRETDIVARLGGDEFAIVQLQADQPRAATVLAERLIADLSRPFDIEGHQVVVGASVGIALAPSDGTEADQLMKSADMALYRAKADGRGVLRYFESEMDAKMQARRALELDLRKALVEHEFELFYQPIVDLKSNRVSGFEALLRWNHPTQGLISPADFIPIAEDMGLITPLGEWVLRQACREAAGWPERVKVAVNLSPAQFKSKALALVVTTALADSGLAPDRLELEITESVLLQDNDTVRGILHQLRALGVRISMDDFGTGYSSLSYLRSFPFDKIKIDQSFVRDMGQHDDSIAIVRAVAGLGRNLGMSTTAEGVETNEQLGRLREEGCTEVQGYLFSRPLPASEVPRLLAQIQLQMRSAA